jgi:uncharacterized iron-regulated protein
MRRVTGTAALLAALIAGCPPAAGAIADVSAETILAAADGAELDRSALAKRLAAADVIYLGEQHGNPYHHAAQLEVLNELVARGRRPAIAFEVASVAQTSELMSFVSSAQIPGHTVDPAQRLREELGWRAGTEWRDYGPLLEFARKNKLRVAGIDLPRSLRRRITRVGVEGLNAVERAQFPDSGFADPAYEQLMRERLNAAHCGFAPPELVTRLYATWLARNDTMTMAVTALAAERPDEPVVVILGLGHVANNMGVYERVAQRAPALRQLNIGFRGRSADTRAADEIAPFDRFGRRFAAPHEIVWLTPPAAGAAGPCDGLEQHLKKIVK